MMKTKGDDMTTFMTDLFTWESDTKTFIADITDIEHVGPINLKNGFMLKSAKTGAVRRLHFLRAINDFDGDLMGWLFTSGCGTFTVSILND
jgi:hypothetical protein